MKPYRNPSKSFGDPLRESLRRLLPSEIPLLYKGGSEAEQRMLDDAWDVFSHSHQLPPAVGNNGEPWTTWLLIGGRGAGKTRAGAEWVKMLANAPKQEDESDRRIALIGETEHETREVMIEGVSGLLAVHPRDARPTWSPTRRRLEWNNGDDRAGLLGGRSGKPARPAILRRMGG